MTLEELKELVRQLIGRARTMEAIDAIAKWAKDNQQDQLKTDIALLKRDLTDLTLYEQTILTERLLLTLAVSLSLILNQQAVESWQRAVQAETTAVLKGVVDRPEARQPALEGCRRALRVVGVEA